MNPLNIEQQSGEWFQYRIGKVGSSGLAKVLAFSKRDGTSLKQREDYKYEKLAEITTGELKSGYVSSAMQFGTEAEPLARAAYEERTGRDVATVGIQPHPSIDRAHASPDGYVGADGAIEIKCPESSTHLRYIREGVIPEEYAPQCWWVLACSGREWLEFVSFDPRQQLRYQLFIKRLYRDESIIAGLNEQVIAFWREVDCMKADLDDACPPIAEPEPADNWARESLLSDADIDTAECFRELEQR